MSQLSLPGSDLLSMLAAKAVIDAIENKEAKDLEQAVQASLAESDSPPENAPSFIARTIAETIKTASKRCRNEYGKEMDNEHHNSGKRPRYASRLGMEYIMNMMNGDINNNNNKSNDDDDDNGEIKRCAVKPDNITITFADVHIGPEALEALDTLMLSIYDPAAFTFGILATSSPQGVLLYGPPGTGKTLLVKALAKQAHATILALSGAEIRSKFHYPCVIFIDEADAIFRSRSAESNCRGHLEDISQFLEEMDGIRSNSIRSPMVIASTNRPFDIDEGVLRRLGRRIMVDVPGAVARDRILRIHLKDEIVADDADLPGLVEATQDYTGSDLQQLVYAAALSAVRENLQCTQRGLNLQEGTSKSPTGSGGPRRVLRKAHFLRAKQEIRASPKSETVAKIREFHNKFGNSAQRVALDDERPETMNKMKSPVSL